MYFSSSSECLLGRNHADIGIEVGQSIVLEREGNICDNPSFDGWFPHCYFMGYGW